MKTDAKFGVAVSSLQRFSLSLGHFRGFLRTSFFPKGMTTNTRRLKLEPSAVMVPLQLRTFFGARIFLR